MGQRLWITRHAPVISLLFFVDDSLLFAKPNTCEARKVLSILETYETASGQVVNLEKFEASFSENVPQNYKQMICNMMGLKAVEAMSRYLDSPIPFGRPMKTIFSHVMDHIWKKLRYCLSKKSRKEKCLSRANKETLIKVVSQDIPNYILSCYQVPVGCCENIDSMLAKFWWGSEEEEKKRRIHWMSWESCLFLSVRVHGV